MVKMIWQICQTRTNRSRKKCGQTWKRIVQINEQGWVC